MVRPPLLPNAVLHFPSLLTLPICSTTSSVTSSASGHASRQACSKVHLNSGRRGKQGLLHAQECCTSLGHSVAVTFHSSTSHRRSIAMAAAAVEDIQAGSVVTKLADLELTPIIDTEGLILSEPGWNAAAYVFAIYDDRQKIQFIGFSKDLKNSLRTVFSRRPEKSHFFKACRLDAVDQDAMVAIRDAWYEELGGAPAGNKLALERVQWQQPVDGGAISQRGKQGAAEDKTRQLLELIRSRGCKEEFVANPTLLQDGLVDFMPARTMSAEEMEESQRRKEEAAKLTRTAVAIIDGHEKKYQVAYTMKYHTNGGHIMDVKVTMDGRETKHRVIVGRDYYEPFGATPEMVVEAAISMLLSLKVSRQTDGLLLSSQYPVNYFSITQIEQWFRDDFRAELAKVIGEKAFDPERDNGFWRFNRIHDYGPMKLEKPGELNVALGNGFEIAYPADD